MSGETLVSDEFQKAASECIERAKVPTGEKDSAATICTEVDEIEPVLDTNYLADTLKDDAVRSAFLEEEAEGLGDNPVEYFDLQTAENMDSPKAKLSLEEAHSSIPESVLNSLKQQFNGSLERCRPINLMDRFF